MVFENDGKRPESLDYFLKILSITEDEFMDIVKSTRYHLGILMKKIFKRKKIAATKIVGMTVKL